MSSSLQDEPRFLWTAIPDIGPPPCRSSPKYRKAFWPGANNLLSMDYGNLKNELVNPYYSPPCGRHGDKIADSQGETGNA